MSGAFDAANFLDDNSTQAGSTKIDPIPAGEYNAIITNLDQKVMPRKDGSGNMVIFEFELTIQAPEVAAKLGRTELKTTYAIFPDVKDGKLDYSQGKNIKLNRLREAAGKNVPGQAFSPRMLVGTPIKVVTKLDPDKNDPSIMYTRVQTVGKL